jgi:heme-degrading monooxygenase HmoA
VVVVIFRSRLASDAGDDYAAMADEMLERARAAPGFVSFHHYTAADGERLALVHWQDEATLSAWRDDARHHVAQRLGRERWYAWFDLEVAHVARRTDFERGR